MKKLSIKNLQSDITFADGCNMYLDNCRQRNLRDGTINHYRSSYTQFFKFFPRSMPLSKITSQSYNDYVVYLTETLDNDISINSYTRHVHETPSNKLQTVQIIPSRQIWNALLDKFETDIKQAVLPIEYIAFSGNLPHISARQIWENF